MYWPCVFNHVSLPINFTVHVRLSSLIEGCWHSSWLHPTGPIPVVEAALRNQYKSCSPISPTRAVMAAVIKGWTSRRLCYFKVSWGACYNCGLKVANQLVTATMKGVKNIHLQRVLRIYALSTASTHIQELWRLAVLEKRYFKLRLFIIHRSTSYFLNLRKPFLETQFKVTINFFLGILYEYIVHTV